MCNCKRRGNKIRKRAHVGTSNKSFINYFFGGLTHVVLYALITRRERVFIRKANTKKKKVKKNRAKLNCLMLHVLI